ncbi:MAG: Calx-beta domain-containing protein, partial [Nitrospirota bacterium]
STSTIFQVKADLADEHEETMTIEIDEIIGNGVRTSDVSGQKKTMIIQNGDPLPTVTIEALPVSIEEEGGVSTITARLNKASGRDVVVNLKSTGSAETGSVLKDTDYKMDTKISIAEGGTFGSVTLSAMTDLLDEHDEKVTVEIESVEFLSTSTAPQSVVVTIVDNDELPQVSFIAGSPQVLEGATTTITVTLNPVSGRTVTVPIVVNASSTANDPKDYAFNTRTLTMLEGQTSATFTVTMLVDQLDEFEETILVEIDTPTFATEFGGQQKIVTIEDANATSSVSLAVDRDSLDENLGATSTNVRVMINKVSAKDVKVTLKKTGRAKEGVDYTLTEQMFIAAGESSTSTLLNILGDPLSEDEEPIDIEIDTVLNAIKGTTTQKTVIIKNDDAPPSVTLSIGAEFIDEISSGTTTTKVIATLGAISGRDVVVTLTKSGSANETIFPIDYTLSSTITIPEGQPDAFVTLSANSDTLNEIPEEVDIEILFDGVKNGVLQSAQKKTVTIKNDDPLPTVTLTTELAEIDEEVGVTKTMVILALNTLSGRDVTVTLTKSGVAKDKVDYDLVDSVMIPKGVLSVSVTLSASGDILDEPAESIVLEINQVTNGEESGGADGQKKTVFILDSDPTPTVTLRVGSINIDEKAGTTSTTTVTAVLREVSGQDVKVFLSKFGGTASEFAPVDYTLDDSIFIPQGASEVSITLAAKDDLIAEPAKESVVISISSVDGADRLGEQKQTVSIIDDEEIPNVTLSVGAPTINETESGTTVTRTTVTATLSNFSSQTITVHLKKSGIAKEDTDYTLSNTITVAPNTISGFTTLTSKPDTLYELRPDNTNEMVIIDIDSVDNGVEKDIQTQQVIILDDDEKPTVALTVVPALISEKLPNNKSSVVAALNTFAGQDVVVTLAKNADSTAIDELDYKLDGITITIPEGKIDSRITLTSEIDLINEFEETVVIDILSVVSGVIKDTVQQKTIRITNENEEPTVSLSIAHTTLQETIGTTGPITTTLQATLSTISAKVVKVTLKKTGSARETATPFIDYTLSDTIVVPAMSRTASVTLSVVGDSLDEIDEKLIIEIASIEFATEFEKQLHIITIADDDATPTVSLLTGDPSINEAGATTTVTARLSAISGRDVTVTLFKDTSSTAKDIFDYKLSTTTIFIPEGTQSVLATLTAQEDEIDEFPEDIVIGIESVDVANKDVALKTVTVNDNDPTPTIRLSVASTITEADGAATSSTLLTATLVTGTGSLVSGLDVTVPLVKSSNSAIEDTDYKLASSILIKAGNPSASVTLSALHDLFNEFNETLTINIGTSTINGTEDGGAGAQQKVVTIVDEDALPTVELTVGSETLAEKDGTTTVTLTLSAVAGRDVTVKLVKSSDAADTVDYRLATTTIVIPALTKFVTVSLTSIDDQTQEPDEKVTLSIDAIEYGPATTEKFGPNGQVKSVTIINDDFVVVTLSVGSANAISASIGEDEGATTTTVTATLDLVSVADVVINLKAEGVAIRGTDYTLPLVITVLKGATVGSVVLASKSDTLFERVEDVNITIDNIVGGKEAGLPGSQKLKVDILNDDAIPTVSLSVGVGNGGSIGELTGTTTLTASLSAISGLDVTVPLDKGDLAIDGTDYTLDNSLVISAGATSTTVTLSSKNDDRYEFNENVSIEIGTPVIDGQKGGTIQTVLIVNDDPQPIVSLSVAPSDISETGGTSSVTATLSAVSNLPTTVKLIKSGMAIAPEDYVLLASIVVPAGTSSAFVTLSAAPDTLDEDHEIVIIEIDADVTNGVKATATSSHKKEVTIINDDSIPVVTLTVGTFIINESTSPTSTAVTASLNTPSGRDVTVFLEKTASSTATDNADYTFSANTITIFAGTTANAVTLSTKNDDLFEEPETVVVKVSGITHGTTTATQTQTVTINDDEPTPAVELIVSPVAIDETGGTTTITVKLNVIAGREVTVNLVKGGSALEGTDYAATSTIIIPRGLREASAVLTASPDAIDEINEEVVIDIQSVVGAEEQNASTTGQQVKVTLNDKNATPTVKLEDPSLLAINESAPNESATLSATLSGLSSRIVTVTLGRAGDAKDEVDYRLPATIEIPAMTLSATTTLSALGDLIDELDREQVIVEISAVTHADELGAQQKMVDILDDEPTPTVALSVSSNSIPESIASSSVTTTVTATLSAVSGLEVEVPLLTGGSAIKGTDYLLPVKIIIPIGKKEASVTLSTEVDTLDETNEIVTINMGTLVNAIATTATSGLEQTVTIVDDTETPSVFLSVDADRLDETNGTSTLVTVTLSTIAGREVKVTLVVSGTPMNGTDYEISTTTIVIPAGVKSRSVTLTVMGDALYERDEIITIEIDQVTDVIESPAQVKTVTIVDNDAVPTVTLLTGPDVINEDGTTGTETTVTARLSAPSGLLTSVQLMKTGNATEGATRDYTLPSKIEIPAGTSTEVVTLTAVGDLLDEENEVVTITIGTVTHGGEAIANPGTQQKEVSITDNDPTPTVTLSVLKNPMGERDGTTTVTVALNVPSGNIVTVNLTQIGSTATDGVDYKLGTTTLTMLKEVTSATTTLEILDDPLAEQPETVVLDILSVNNGNATKSGSSTTVTIVDDEVIPFIELLVGTTTLSEIGGTTTTVTVKLSEVAGHDVVITLKKSGTAIDATDYRLGVTGTTTLTIFAGATSTTAVFTIEPDDIDEDADTLPNEKAIIEIESIADNRAKELGGDTGQKQEIEIVDNDATPTITLSLVSPAIHEEVASGTITTELTATLSAVSGLPVKVTLGKSGNAMENVDYTLTGLVIDVPAGIKSRSVTISAQGDLLNELNETIDFVIQSLLNTVQLDPPQGIIRATITDNDPIPTVTLAPVISTLSETGGVTMVKATLSAPSGQEVKVNFSKGGVANAVDYSLAGFIVIPTTQKEVAISLTVTPDDFYERDETIILEITTIDGGKAIKSGSSTTVTISDDDAVPTVTLEVGTSTILESAGTTTVTARLSAPSGLETTVPLLRAGDAKDTEDYIFPNPIIISAGNPSGSVVLTIVNDVFSEASEPIVIEIGTMNPLVQNANASSTQQQQTVIILDNDGVPTVDLSVDHFELDEDSGTTTTFARLKLSARSNQDVKVELAFGGTAKLGAGLDYTSSATSTITIPAGSETATIIITSVPDTLFETESEFIIIDIATVVNATTTAGQKRTILIKDNDPIPTVTLSRGLEFINEDPIGTSTAVTAKLSNISGINTIVTLKILGTALQSVDYTLPTTITVPAGAGSADVVLESKFDALFEGDETVLIDIEKVENGTSTPPQQQKVTIRDNDDRSVVSLEVVSIVLGENSGGTSTVVKAKLTNPSGLDVVVNLKKDGSTATDTVDYTFQDQITVVAGTLQTAIVLQVNGDVFDEENEVINLTIKDVVDGTANIDPSKSSTTTTIMDDDDEPTVELTVGAGEIDEDIGTTSTSVTLTLSERTQKVVDVVLKTTGETDAADFTLAATSTLERTITIPSMTKSVVVTLAAIGDNTTSQLDELNESVIIDIDTVVNAGELNGTSGQQKTVKIIDDDTTFVTISVDPSTIRESPFASSTAVVKVLLSNISSQSVTVDFTLGGNATSSDYTFPLSVTVPPNNREFPVTLAALNDTAFELAETVKVTIDSVTNATKGTTTADIEKTITIQSEDPKPTVTLSVNPSALTINEPTTGTTSTEIIVSLDFASGHPVSMTLVTSGNAADGDDYRLSTKNITIPAGATSSVVILTAEHDVLNELNEEVTIRISDLVDGIGDPIQQVVTVPIIDNDAEPSVTLLIGGNGFIKEDTGATTTTVTATLSAVSGKAVKVTLAMLGDATRTPATPIDYTLAGEIIIPIGEKAATTTLFAEKDLLDEFNEQVIIDIDAVEFGIEFGTSTGGQRQVVTIEDDDDFPKVDLSVSNGAINEDSGVTETDIIVTLSEVAGRPVTVTLTKTGTAFELTDPKDYTATSSIVIPTGAKSAKAVLSALPDSLNEINEEVVIDINTISPSGPIGLGTTTRQIVIINDNDAKPNVTLLVGSNTLDELNGTTSTTVTAELNVVSGQEITINLVKAGISTAVDLLDYTMSTTTILIPRGVISGSVTLFSREDSLNEPPETIVIQIGSVTTNVDIKSGAQEKVVTINNDDPIPTVTLTTSGVSIAEKSGQVILTAKLSAVSSFNIPVTFTKSGNALDNTDYTLNGNVTILAGQDRATVALTSKDDFIYEKKDNIQDEEVIVKITGTGPNATTTTEGPTEVKVTIADDEPIPTVRLSVIAPAEMTETTDTAGTIQITATLSAKSGLDVKVNLAKSNVAKNNIDYTLNDFILIPADSDAASITLAAKLDLLNESDLVVRGEEVTIDIDTLVDGEEEGTRQFVTVLIVDNDEIPTVTLAFGTGTSTSGTLQEDSGATTTVITARLSAPSGRIVKVNLTKGGIAINAKDYTLATTTIVIPELAASAAATLSAIADTLNETDETIDISVNSIENANASSTAQLVTGKIINDDALPKVTLVTNVPNINETVAQTGIASVTAKLNTASGRPVTVFLVTSGMATNGSDYTLATSTIVIPTEALAATTTLTALDDTTAEIVESVIIDINSVTDGEEQGTQQQTVTITDNEGTPTVQLSVNSTIISTVGETGATTTEITATSSAVAELDIVVFLKKLGLAVDIKDYNVQNSITIPAGSKTATVVLTTVNDTLYELEERAVIEIESVLRGTELGNQAVTVIMQSEDPKPTVSLTTGQQSISEDTAAATSSTAVIATLSTPSGLDVIVTFGKTSTSTPAAIDGTDYKLSETSLTIPAGISFASVTLSSEHDLLDEVDETVTMSILSVNEHGTNASVPQTVAIKDNDALPVVTLAVGSNTMSENAATSVTLTIAPVSGRDVTVILSKGGNATEGAAKDYTLDTTVTIVAGTTTNVVMLSSVPDTLNEENETVIIGFSSITNGTTTATQTQTVTITDDDVVPTVTLLVGNANILEDSATTTVTATLNTLSGRDVVVTLGTASSAAVAVTDFALAGSMTIPAGATSTFIVLTPKGDPFFEEDETVLIDITSVGTNATTTGGQQQKVTILNDDVAPTVSITVATSTLSEDTGITSTNVNVSLDALSNLPTKVTFTKLGVAIDGTDYRMDNEVTIPAQTGSSTVQLSTILDTLFEREEDIIISLNTTTNGLKSMTENQVTVKIPNDDDKPSVSLSVATSTISESAGNTSSLTATNVIVTLNRPSGLPVQMTLLKTGSIATDVDDYTLADTITIPAGTSSTTTVLTAKTDAIDEAPENVKITLANVVDGTIFNNTQDEDVTILDTNDAPTVTLLVGTNTITENLGSSTSVTAQLNISSAQDVIVTLEMTGTPTQPADYIATTTITILAGLKTASITLESKDDSLNEGNESIIIDIASVLNAMESGEARRTVMILDNDPIPSVRLSSGLPSVNENASTTSITATLSEKSGLNVAVTLKKSGTAATSTADYTLSNTAIDIPAGEISASVTFTAVSDTLYERNETATLMIDTISASATRGNPESVSIEIVDDDPVPTLTLTVNGVGANSSINEASGVANLVYSIGIPSGFPVVITISKVGSMAIEGATRDYTLVGTVTIPAGATSETVALTAIDDTLDEAETESVIVTTTQATDANASAIVPTTVNIVDNDARPLVTLLTSVPNINETASQ